MPITITVTDGLLPAVPIVIEDARIAVTAAALSAAAGITAPPVNAAAAISQAVAAWIKTTRKQGRLSDTRQASEAKFRADVLIIEADEIKAP